MIFGLKKLFGITFGLVGLGLVLTPLAEAQQANQNRSQVRRQAEDFKSWRVVCDDRDRDGKVHRSCFMQQVVILSSTKKPVFEVAIDPPVGGKASRAAVIAPLGTKLADGVLANISGVDPFKLGFRHCDRNGCWAIFDVNQNLLAALKAGNQIEFTMLDATSGKPFKFDISLSGFSAAYQRLQEVQPKS